ncbi:hypothetical protein FIBSPDRAFT_1050252 [Athelia psychrophila]|uniref:Uncharacterized protein n=1 Tax=Athelia psychrophila TaxID=1759441 RepID=A0A166AY80_9AGAM|nr:hypothetical protein FIBSPDRAFT_1050252 [Fibularhizoctonia sp. CBS 109695]
MEKHDVSIPAHLEVTVAEDDLRPPRRTLLHLAVVAALVIPIGLVPCLVARRTTNALSRRIRESFTIIDKLQKEVNTLNLDRALRRDELARTRGVITEMRRETRAMNAEAKRYRHELRAEAERLATTHAAATDALRSNLCSALEDARNTQLDTQRELGTSLADIAAFMHEQSLMQGKATASIERLRLLALGLQTSSSKGQDLKPPNNNGAS